MPESQERAGYWYGADAATTSTGVLEALRRYREAEQAMRRRTRASMGMGETDMIVVRHLLLARRQHRDLTAGDLAGLLQISTASTTALIDRLERSGHVRRERHPQDRRSTRVVATIATDDEVRATLGAMHRNMMAVAEALSPAEAEVVARFLTGMVDAVAAVDVGPIADSSDSADSSGPPASVDPDHSQVTTVTHPASATA
ncbi:MarR family winged helix-turn-helix transcriptional regulator [Plantibacter sp. RU18]|uniref:MarR family winged helix-turn-helix transcriptional regulator n=1 Tax=Plantibacter sp. RU18 TaxID=3158143 RepID=UPI003D360CAC